MMAKVLIVDDDVNFCVILKSYLGRKGYEADEAYTCNDALRLLQKNGYDVVLTDFRLPDKNGLELLKEIKDKNSDAVVILMTAYADIRMAVKAIKLGAFEYVTKPVNPEEILMYIKKGMGRQPSLETPGHAEKTVINSKGNLEYVYASSKESRAIHDYIALVSPTDMSVIIQGESGTGKEYIARKIHEQSKRKSHPFVAIDCGSLSKELAGSEFFGHIKGSFTGALNDKTGQFEAANKGTLFLDEIGNLSYEVQVKLLRAIQERKIRKIGSNKDISVDVRLITATNEDLRESVRRGAFREDLYHRLNEFSVHVPPLRERKEDITVFINFFLEKANQELDKKIEIIPGNIMDSFWAYPWPGNIREVKNVVRRAVLLSKGNELSVMSLPEEIPLYMNRKEKITESLGNDLKSQTEKTEKELIIATLQKAKFNKSRAAKILNIDRKTLYNKIKLYGISGS
ncbi:MAG: sigma-54-dependent Fis family transcriptional regulator [Bacteroidetes bacterium]|nr:MAG: sigma-54-dependent Fis family transcriptional regulator [Bacteroidota bacterium]